MMQSSLSALNVRKRAKAREFAPRGLKCLVNQERRHERPSDGKRAYVGADLTGREAVTAFLAAAGLTNEEIARRLGLGVETIKVYMSHVMTKCGFESRAEIVSRLIHG